MAVSPEGSMVSTDQCAQKFLVLVYISRQCTPKLLTLTLWRLRHAVSTPFALPLCHSLAAIFSHFVFEHPVEQHTTPKPLPDG